MTRPLPVVCEGRMSPDNYRGMLALLHYVDGTEKCVGCDLCEAACPSRVIAVVSAEVPADPTRGLFADCAFRPAQLMPLR